MRIIDFRKTTYIISGILVGASLLSLAVWGLKLGIDFTGGSLLEVEYINIRPENKLVLENLAKIGVNEAVLQPTGEKGLILRLPDINEEKHQEILIALGGPKALTDKQFTSIGPTIGKELRRNSLWAIAAVMLAILAYIAWAFRYVSRPIASWKYGIAALIALIHDITIPTGIFAVLGRFYGVTIDTLFVTALLTILGFSVHDTIVVFDRVRENLKKIGQRESFDEIVERSLRQTIVRSINTSLTVILAMLALYIFGGLTTKYFALAILLGVFFGTYSSIFIASFILITWNKFSLKRA
ncbi:protein-export membrane protein SecF [Candidatus Giovannonibacteria bacterium RIFCSPHIGHO2_02_43_13]|uniref:Protein-export membrane protein SecF n=1 Tax=Candidatus Giovannonibacteria bacterium RIFCSPHIGHO2_02_43_13 TaxID=1798330 RepID=A0A1F5WUL7_9BACT|nr:MAG: protein-export membrane protein SecF [Candidatus Giovannonibacteria bacterium RIFCSPHIGHO2_12_FULL_44_42]OGF79339.1 MAG: protein-export membrane protein SecF [Candidatus Giovannonibacteria bacterium RIFCSPHIGHO2_02_43_13]OGF90274.1 MAG: protein-export membrane protein SecF [Candidatus Giovannonibacteria bacterium RIFCSPLOWO2_02_FULL_43_54]OGF97256.1 MAG: protein-export membrane protein SecF [Candidatus Giovannonibacteria bacterium RIFCSPLOWO2_12_FULL_44_32]